MNVHLLIVDPQNDFCVKDDGHGHHGTLVVDGADRDMDRLAKMIRRIGPKLDEITVTMDSHQTVGIERPLWWKRTSDGAHPDPFTCLGIHPDGRRIVKYDLGAAGGPLATDEEYITTVPSQLHQGGVTGKGSFGYLQALAAIGRIHIVWTEHCRVGSWGWGVVPVVDEALRWWEAGAGQNGNLARVNYIPKGNNPYTEHFSGIKAEIEDPGDPGTMVNGRTIASFAAADIILLTGEALSHCLAATGRDLAAAFSDPRFIAKFRLLADTTSNVTGFSALGDAFIKDLTSKGMILENSETFLA